MNLKQFKLTKDQRVFFLISSSVQWLGLWLSDFNAHWVLFIPPIFFLGASLNGYCSGMILTKILFGKTKKNDNKQG